MLHSQALQAFTSLSPFEILWRNSVIAKSDFVFDFCQKASAITALSTCVSSCRIIFIPSKLFGKTLFGKTWTRISRERMKLSWLTFQINSKLLLSPSKDISVSSFRLCKVRSECPKTFRRTRFVWRNRKKKKKTLSKHLVTELYCMIYATDVRLLLVSSCNIRPGHSTEKAVKTSNKKH